MVIGLLTAGGDCPGLNAAIRGVVARATSDGHQVVGFANGWEGLIADRPRLLDRDAVRGIVGRGGTILGTSRMDPYVHADGANSVKRNIQKHEIDCLIVIGGDGSLRAASRLQAEGLSIVGIPKTIDNDVGGTEVSLGFHTAVQIVVDAIDRLTTTAEAHNRIMVIEVMGRTAGWIAGVAGLAGGAEAILVPESAIDYPDLAVRLTKRHDSGHDYSIVVVAEGIPDPTGQQTGHEVDQFGFERLGGVANGVAAELERLTAYEARVMSLGYLQRGGSPTAFDRVLGSRFGIRAAELAMEGVSGVMVALQCDSIVEVDLAESCRLVRELDPRRLEEASWFFA